MAKTATISVYIDPEVKEKAETILAELGISPSVAINMLYRQIILTKRIPFPINSKYYEESDIKQTEN